MVLTNNIDLVRVYLNGEKIFYLPKNTNFDGKKVGRVFVLGGMRDKNIEDPYTGKKLIALSEYNNITLTLKNTAGEIVVNDVPLIHFLINQDSNKCTINDVIDWENSFVNLQQADSIRGGEELLMYVTYDDTYRESVKFNKAISIKIDTLQSHTEPIIKKLSDYINDKTLGQLVKLESANYLYWGGTVWIKLYDKKGRNIDLINGNIFNSLSGSFSHKTGINYPQLNNKNNPILFNYLDVDFEKSEIFNIAAQNETFYLTLYFN